ncbi:MAG: methanogenesis marker protein 6 [Candidatus Methanomethylophilaceae archaeon]|jgi:putative methanogenesis marker protein 6|nr:methanogenesis marker protein 6 [Candidatus Methanomethylophilaceae archaeon]MBO5669398.1 methanogenesis marker protein 6 [Candidatus Methanomethylophilaceae archaeon]MBO7205534.1 methanogenesis marker protein 6 [Candidatus Methanomethylophilaceae archaeon]
MSEERETRLLMISPSSRLTPEMLARNIHSMGVEVGLKETCYGCLIEGRRESVLKVAEMARKLQGNSVFSKRRAYRMGDPVRCRAQHGTRPGYSQLEAEWAALPFIEAGLDALDRGEKYIDIPAKEKLSVEKLIEICEVKL